MSLLLLLLLACCLLVAAVGSVTLFMLLLSPGGNAFLLVVVGFLMTTFPYQQQQHSSCCFCCGPYCLSHHLRHGSLPTLSSSIGAFLLHHHPEASQPIVLSPLFSVVTCSQPKSFAFCKDVCDDKQEMRWCHQRCSFKSILVFWHKCESSAKPNWL